MRSARIARADMSASRTARAVSGASLGSGARPLRRRARALVRAPNGSHPTKKVPSTVIRCGSKVARQGAYRVTDLPEDESDLLARIHTSIQAALSDGKVLLDVEVPACARAFCLLSLLLETSPAPRAARRGRHCRH